MADRSVLQEFTINFDLDLSNVEKATQEVQKSISAIGAEYLPQLENMLNEVTQSVGDLVDTTALQTMINNIKNGVEVSTDEIIKLTDDTFTALSEVMEKNDLMWSEKTQSWVAIAKETADKVEQVFNGMDLGKDLELSELENLLEQIKEISGGSFDTSEFEKALERIRNGADLTAEELMELKEKMQEALKKAERLEKIKSIFSNIKSWFSGILIGGFGGFGILNNIVDTIQETFAFQGKNNGFFSQNDLKTAQEYQKSLSKINEFLGQIQKMIARFLLPIVATLSTLLTKTIDFIVKHHKTIMLFLGALAVALSGIIKAQLAILATQLKILAPYIAIAAAVAAIVAIIEDIYYYFKGWDSVTGELVEKFPLLGTALEIIKPLIMGIFETIDKIKEFFKNPSVDNFIAIFETLWQTIENQVNKIIDIFADAFSEIGEAWNNIDWNETFKQLFVVDWWNEQLNNIIKWFNDTFTQIGDFFKEIFNLVLDWLSEKIKAIIEPIKNIGKNVADFGKGVKDKVGKVADGVKGFFGVGKNEPSNALNMPLIPNYATSTTNNDTTYNNTMNFTLNGVDEQTAKFMSNDISRQINQYQSQVSSKGVK